ncbi:MAG: RNA pyrophosphohydrolase [Verrucomicrobiota bacterium]|nr:RNA pyrophosphohydrolase [Verrucomicrobiota bacterium]
MKYRANVAAIIRNPQQKILVCERLTVPGGWQFPQGGVDEGESREQALHRELWEEVGLAANDYRILESRGPYRYVYGDGRLKKGYHGKEQHYFLCELLAPDARINIATANPEFRAWQWIAPEEFRPAWLPEMKRAVYRTVFADFFSITMGDPA